MVEDGKRMVEDGKRMVEDGKRMVREEPIRFTFKLKLDGPVRAGSLRTLLQPHSTVRPCLVWFINAVAPRFKKRYN